MKMTPAYPDLPALHVYLFFLFNSLTPKKEATKFSSANFLTLYQKADNKIFVCKFSKYIKSKLYHIERSKTRGQTV